MRSEIRLTSLRFALAALALLCLCGCAPGQRQLLRTDAIVAAQIDHRLSCARADRCAHPSALRTLGRGDGRNHAIILDLGEDALIARINLIRAARQDILIQTFIWADDDAGNLVLDELVRAARRGVQVRVLADQLGSFNNLAQLAQLARTHVNFELRLYNPTLHAAVTTPLGYLVGGLCCFTSINQRMHNKLLVVDGVVGITGGRNYENKYFDWDPAFAFLDRDVLVSGPVAADMRRSFERFWQHPRAVPIHHLRDVGERLRSDGSHAPVWQTPAYDQPQRVARVQRQAIEADYIRQHFLLRAQPLAAVQYFSDLPGKTVDGDLEDRALTAHLTALMADARQEIVLQTPYLVLSDSAQDVFRTLAREHPEVVIRVSTNSLAATDSFAAYALAHKYVRRYLAVFGFKLYEFKPHPQDAARMVAHHRAVPAPAAVAAGRVRNGQVPLTTGGLRISLHAKSLVVDRAVVMIGSHNFDPRSDVYNTESGLIVHDPAFADLVRASILASTSPGNAWVVTKRQVDGLLGRINRVLAKLSARLPLFDLWPFGYATSWQLKPGYAPVLPGDPRFYQHYRPVGEFPEVALPLKTIYTRIITGFGAGIRGML